MNLKEAFRYQNFLSSIHSDATSLLRIIDNSFKTTHKHLLSTVNAEEEDKTEVVDKYTGGYYPTDALIAMLNFTIEHQQRLSHAISEAKHSCGVDIDALIIGNRSRRDVVASLRRITAHKPNVSYKDGTAYKFNAEGNQVPYRYKIEVTVEDDFDRAAMSRLIREYNALSDKASSDIENAMINTQVFYEPELDVNLTFDEAFEIFNK